ncbi:hypothetical protein ACHAXT_006420 [Thalassiosira profunda]
MVSSTLEEDPWAMLEDFKVWAVLNRGKYDLLEFHSAINNLRQECQLNIQTLETEIASIQQTLDEEQSQFDRSQNPSGTEIIVEKRVHKAVFAGYQVTEEDRRRLRSAHPVDGEG